MVLKFDQQATNRLDRERAALELLVDSDLTVPAFVAADTLHCGRPWLVMTRLPGEPPVDALASPHDISVGLGRQLGALTARLHAGPRPPGFGTWGMRDRWSLVEEDLARTAGLTELSRDAGIVSADEVRDLLALMATTRSALKDAPTAPVLAHRDLQPRNVLVDNRGELTALLDFESAGGGDPAEDFKTIGLDWETPGFAAFCAGYASAGSFDASFAERAAHHVLFWALAVFAYLGNVVPGSTEHARRAIDRVRSGQRPPIPSANL